MDSGRRGRPLGRRSALRAGLMLPAALVLPWRAAAPAAADEALQPTPACAEPAEPTPRQTAGPFFRPDSPERRSLLEPGLAGRRVLLEGTVLTTACRPIPGALLDVWHADPEGRYDNAGYRCRGHQFADAAGRYRLETVVPGLYPGRTRHIHLHVQPLGGRVLTTQLYFPGEPQNERDGLFRPELLIATAETAAGLRARFDFVLA